MIGVGRNAKPISLYLAQKNPNRLTQSEIERRKQNEIKLGNAKLKCPVYVKNNVNAYAKWKEITKIFKDIDFVSSGDSGLLGRYCMAHSEYMTLLDQRQKIERFEIDYSNLANHFDVELLEGLDSFFRFDPVMKLDNAINKKMDMLIKMEDRLFLNPLSKVKNVPKKEPKKEDPLDKKGFGNV